MTQILHSEWLIKMLQKSGVTPKARMLSLFDILNDWQDAPHTQNVTSQSADSQPTLLLDYLTTQAETADAAMPQMLAEQLLFLATSAINANTQADRNLAIEHAKRAASALITAQCETEKTALKPIYATAAGLVFAVAIGAMLLHKPATNIISNLSSKPQPLIANHALHMFTQKNMTKAVAGDPKHTAELYTSIETMRGGDCQFIEALQIPDADKKIYLENVVGGQVPTNAHDQIIAQRYLQKIRCNYTPMLMKNSTN